MRIMRRRLRYCIAILFFVFVSISLFLAPSAFVANAMSDEPYPPTCELSFANTANTPLLSKSSVVNYNDGTARLSTTYKFSASEPTTLVCSLPVYCQLFDVANCGASLSLNGTKATPTYRYAFRSPFFSNTDSYSDIIALQESHADLDRSIAVHKFIASATNETTFSFSLQPEDHILYSFNRHKYTAANRLYEVNVSPNVPCSFTVFGNKPTVEASESCSITYSLKSIDEYLTEQSEFMSIMTNGTDCSEIVTHWVTNFLASSTIVSEQQILYDCEMRSYAYLDYSLSLPLGESTIIVEQSMAVGRNSLYEPTVYVGKILSPAQTAPLSFSVNTEQYVVDSTLSLNNNSYKGEAVEAVTIAFCTVKDPTLVNSPTVAWEPWRIAVLSVGCVLGAVGIVWLIVVLIKMKKSHKEKKNGL